MTTKVESSENSLTALPYVSGIQSKFRDWDVFEVLPKGWKIDNSCGSPLYGYDFCIDGKSILNGGKRGLVKTVRKGLPRIEYVKTEPEQKQKTIEVKENFIFPPKTVNTLARKKFEELLLREIRFDLMVCEIEGWDKKEYIKELRKLLNSINLSTNKKHNENATLDLFSDCH